MTMTKVFMSEKSQVFKNALDDVFGCCPDFNTGRDKINDKPREMLLQFSTGNNSGPSGNVTGRFGGGLL